MCLEDNKIIELFFARSEQALAELSAKYGRLIFGIAKNILGDEEDARECENDTYLGAWRTIPPERPNPLSAYVCRIARNLSLKKYRSKKAQKRDCAFDLSMEELGDCLAAPSIEETWSARELGQAIGRFLDTQNRESRTMFMRRYWFCDSIKEIAQRFAISENNASVKLSRIRVSLKKYLQKEGFDL